MVSVFMRADVSAVSLDCRIEQWLNSNSDVSTWSGAIYIPTGLEVWYEFANSQ